MVVVVVVLVRVVCIVDCFDVVGALVNQMMALVVTVGHYGHC